LFATLVADRTFGAVEIAPISDPVSPLQVAYPPMLPILFTDLGIDEAIAFDTPRDLLRISPRGRPRPRQGGGLHARSCFRVGARDHGCYAKSLRHGDVRACQRRGVVQGERLEQLLVRAAHGARLVPGEIFDPGTVGGGDRIAPTVGPLGTRRNTID